MAQSPLLTDALPARADATPTRSAPETRAEDGEFNRVQEDIARDQKARSRRIQDRQQDRQEAASKAAEPKSEARTRVAGDKQAVAGRDQQQEDDYGLTGPVADPYAGGKSLPPGVSATGAGEASIRQLFLSMAQGQPTGSGSGYGLAGQGLGEGGLEAFRATLAEAVESKAGSNPESAGTAVMTGQRGLEIREGSALIRQYSTTVETPVQQGEWGDKMADKISWLANQRISFAEIHISPPDMGPVDVRVSVQNDQATVTLHSQNPTVRDLLELNGQRLRDMLHDSGLNLTQLDVSDQPAGQQQSGDSDGDGDSPRGSAAVSGGDEHDLVSLDGGPVTTGELHLNWESRVDTYA